MRHNPKLTARLPVLAVLSGIVLMCGSAFTQDKTDPGNNIKALKEQRLALLVKIEKGTAEVYKQSSETGITIDQVRQTKADVFTARLDLAETRDDRIKICEEMLNEAAGWAKFVQVQVDRGEVGALDAVKAQAHVLATRIALENAKASK